ncbi:HAMP domain-containing sensor histidine kinase [Paraflavitalea speifideaquila]|uniref:sensor histidine kinase n=1 Tax=Paraflavitalea speifideaquila TaxID=3076558 RepID=UPI0028E2AB00|nr:HAMP domain-containing sensor histidine kinase [Paraflavitalea speifideiaquila]
MALVQGRDKETAQLQLMQRNGERLLRLTNQLLDFRQFEAGGMPLEVSEGNITAFIQEILQSYEGYAAQQQIGLSLETNTTNAMVWFDGDKLEKILYNLLSNAFKFTPAGGLIKVSLHTTATHTTIEVEDNGAGIAPDRLPSILILFTITMIPAAKYRVQALASHLPKRWWPCTRAPSRW